MVVFCVVSYDGNVRSLLPFIRPSLQKLQHCVRARFAAYSSTPWVDWDDAQPREADLPMWPKPSDKRTTVVPHMVLL